MIEKIILDHIKSTCAIPAFCEEPATKPREYALLRVYDYGRENQIDGVTVDVVCISDSMANASALNERVKNAMLLITANGNVSACRVGGGGQNIDRTKKIYRYNTVFNIFYMEE